MRGAHQGHCMRSVDIFDAIMSLGLKIDGLKQSDRAF